MNLLSNFKTSGLTINTLNTTNNLLKIINTAGDVGSISPADLFASLGGVSGTGAANRVALWNGAGSLTSDAGITWLASGGAKLTVLKNYTNTAHVAILAVGDTATIGLESTTAGKFTIATNYQDSNTTSFLAGVGTSAPSLDVMTFRHITGYIGLGTSTPGAKLHVAGGAIAIGSGAYTSAVAGDLAIAREISSTTAAIYFGNTGSSSIYYNGSSYTFSGGSVIVPAIGGITAGNTPNGAGATSIDNNSGTARLYQFNNSATLTTLIQTSGNSYINGGSFIVGNTTTNAKFEAYSSAAGTSFLGKFNSATGNATVEIVGNSIATQFVTNSVGTLSIRTGATSGTLGTSRLEIAAAGTISIPSFVTALNIVRVANTSGDLEAVSLATLGIPTGTGAANRLVIWSGTTTQTSDANLVFASSRFYQGTPGTTITGFFPGAFNIDANTDNGLILKTANASADLVSMWNAVAAGSNLGYLKFYKGVSRTVAGGIDYYDAQAGLFMSSPKIMFGAAMGTSNPLTFVSGVGLGVNTYTPGATLDVAGNAIVGIGSAANSDYTINIRAGSFSGSQAKLAFQFGAAFTEQGKIEQDVDNGMIIGSVANQGLSLITNNTTRVTVLPAGNVGIGTVSPQTKLDVNGTINASATFGYALGVTAGLPNGVGGMYHTNGATTGTYLIFANLGNIRLSPEAGGNGLFLQKTTGSIGVNTLTPDSRFHVVDATGAGLRVGYNGTATNYYDATTHYIRGAGGAVLGELTSSLFAITPKVYTQTGFQNIAWTTAGIVVNDASGNLATNTYAVVGAALASSTNYWTKTGNDLSYTIGNVDRPTFNGGGASKLNAKPTYSYRDIYASPGDQSVTGAFVLEFPFGWTNGFQSWKLKGYNYTNSSYWELTISFYNYAGSGGYYTNVGALVSGNQPFSEAFLSFKGGKCQLILGPTTTYWAAASIVVSEGITVNNGGVYTSGWVSSFTTDITTGFSQTVALTLYPAGATYQHGSESYINLKTQSVYNSKIASRYDAAEPFYIETYGGKLLGRKAIGSKTNVSYLSMATSVYGAAITLANPSVDSDIKVWIDYTGDVGIGTITPVSGSKLTLDYGASGGFAVLKNTGANEWGVKFNDASNSIFGFTGNGATGQIKFGALYNTYFLSLYSGNAEAVRILTNGNVGIGTTTPIGKLDISTTSGSTIFRNVVAAGGTAGNDNLAIKQDFISGVAANYTWSNSNYSFAVARNGGSMLSTQTGALAVSQFVVDYLGNVGIGTTPEATSRIYATAAGDTYYRFETSAGGVRMVLASALPAYNEFYFGDGWKIGGWPESDFVLSKSGTKRFFVNGTTGNVGIGTASPNTLFDVKTGTDAHVNFFLSSGIGTIGALNDAGSAYTPLGFYASSFTFGLGNVAIGTTTADSKFRVLASSGAGLRIDFSGTNSNYYDANNHYIRNSSGGLLMELADNYLRIPKFTVAGNILTVDDVNGVITSATPASLGIVNWYTTDGTLTSNRTVTQAGYTLNFTENIGIYGITVGRGPGNVDGNFTFATYSATTAKTGANNIFIGADAGKLLTSGSQNVFLGNFAGRDNVTGTGNVCIGQQAGKLYTSSVMTAVGNFALQNATQANTAVGSSALQYVTSGGSNTALGIGAGAAGTSGHNLTTGQYNTFLGTQAGFGIVDGNYNVVIGRTVTELAASLSNNVIIGDGQGTVRYQADANGNTTITGRSLTLDATSIASYPADVFTQKLNLASGTHNYLRLVDASNTLVVRGQINSTEVKLETIGSTGRNLRFSGDTYVILGAGGGEFKAHEDGWIGLTGGIVADPSSPDEGALWYRSDIDKLRLRKSASSVTITTYAETKASVVRDVVVYTAAIIGTGVIDMGFYRVPAEFDGYALIGVSYSVFSAGTGTGEVVVQTKKNATGVHGATFAVGDVQKDVSGTGITVATGDLLKIEIVSHSMTVGPTGLTVTYLFSPI